MVGEVGKLSTVNSNSSSLSYPIHCSVCGSENVRINLNELKKGGLICHSCRNKRAGIIGY